MNVYVLREWWQGPPVRVVSNLEKALDWLRADSERQYTQLELEE